MPWYGYVIGSGVLGGILFASGAGVWLLVFFLRRIVEGCRAARWPYTAGTLVSVEKKDVGDGCREVAVRYS